MKILGWVLICLGLLWLIFLLPQALVDPWRGIPQAVGVLAIPWGVGIWLAIKAYRGERGLGKRKDAPLTKFGKQIKEDLGRGKEKGI